MARYRGDMEEDRDFYARNERFGRERPWSFSDPYDRERSFPESRERFGRGRFGERAEYEYDEPRYGGYSREMDYGHPRYERDYRRRPEMERGRSRLRVREIMTRDLAVATRDTTARELARMMKDEDTGVIPVVDYDLNAGDGRSSEERRFHSGNGNYGKLVGLVTDRDIVVRAVAEDKDCRSTRAEEIMSTDIYAAKPNDRVIDVIRKMGDKQVRRIPVVGENGHLRGMVSLGDVAVETEADQELADALEDISKESSFWNRILGS